MPNAECVGFFVIGHLPFAIQAAFFSSLLA
jgi:hypothetical protein